MTTFSSTAPAAARVSSRIEGYASLFGIEDHGRDIVVSGAFRTALAERGAANIRMLFQHDPAQPIGAWDEIREDARGLFVRGHLIGEAPRAREILALIRGRALDGLSIGFRARRAVRDARTGQRRLYDIDLWEISIVTFPMLPGPRVTAVKHCAAVEAGMIRGPTDIARELRVRRDETNVAALPLARPRPAAIFPSPVAAPRSPYPPPAAGPRSGGTRGRARALIS